MRLFLAFCLMAVILSCAVESGARVASGRHSCPASVSLCRCGRRGRITCSKQNCLSELPTVNLTSREGAGVRSLYVTSQRDLRVIRNRDFAKLPNLRQAVLVNNPNLHYIEQHAFNYTPYITELDLHHNSFDSFPRVIASLRHLVKLNLGGNKIAYIPTDAFRHNPKLQQLVLRRNRLDHFPRQLPTALVKLTIGHNLLYNLEDMRHLSRLTTLRVNSNRLTRIPSELLPASLRELSACQNLLTSQSSLNVDRLQNLRTLRLAGNPRLGRITRETFYSSTNRLRDLDLRRSGITLIDSDALANLGRLRAVDMSENRISRFEPGWFRYSGRLRRVSMANNTWLCTCEMARTLNEFSREIQRRERKTRSDRPLVTDFDLVKCSSLSFDLQRNNVRAMRNGKGQKMANYDFSSCPQITGRWRFLKAPSQIDVDGNFLPTTKKQTTTTTQRHITTHRPTTTTQRLTTHRPTIATRRPTTTTQRTTTTTRRPTTTTRRPTTTTRRPTTTTRRPTTTTRRPTTTTRRPTTTTRRPTTTTRRPTTTTRRPTTTTRRPTTTTRRPATTTRRPTTTTRRPTTTTERTTTTTKRPITTEETFAIIKPPTRIITTTESTWTANPTTTITTTRTTTTEKTSATTRQTTTTASTTETPTTKESTTTPQTTTAKGEICTDSGKCNFPFSYQGVDYTDSCVDGTTGLWCYVGSTWDYCRAC